jgi:hypothetical protein
MMGIGKISRVYGTAANSHSDIYVLARPLSPFSGLRVLGAFVQQYVKARCDSRSRIFVFACPGFASFSLWIRRQRSGRADGVDA